MASTRLTEVRVTSPDGTYTTNVRFAGTPTPTSPCCVPDRHHGWARRGSASTPGRVVVQSNSRRPGDLHPATAPAATRAGGTAPATWSFAYDRWGRKLTASDRRRDLDYQYDARD
jgi:hypothetical protein